MQQSPAVDRQLALPRVFGKSVPSGHSRVRLVGLLPLHMLALANEKVWSGRIL